MVALSCVQPTVPAWTTHWRPLLLSLSQLRPWQDVQVPVRPVAGKRHPTHETGCVSSTLHFLHDASGVCAFHYFPWQFFLPKPRVISWWIPRQKHVHPLRLSRQTRPLRPPRWSEFLDRNAGSSSELPWHLGKP